MAGARRADDFRAQEALVEPPTTKPESVAKKVGLPALTEGVISDLERTASTGRDVMPDSQVRQIRALKAALDR